MLLVAVFPVVSTSREASSRRSRVPLSRVNFSGFVGRTTAILEGQIGMVYIGFIFGLPHRSTFLGDCLFNMNYNPLPIVTRCHESTLFQCRWGDSVPGCIWMPMGRRHQKITPRAGFARPNMVLSVMLCAFAHFQPQARVVPSHHVDRMIYIYIYIYILFNYIYI